MKSGQLVYVTSNPRKNIPQCEAMVGSICEVMDVQPGLLLLYTPDYSDNWAFPFSAVRKLTQHEQEQLLVQHGWTRWSDCWFAPGKTAYEQAMPLDLAMEALGNKLRYMPRPGAVWKGDDHDI